MKLYKSERHMRFQRYQFRRICVTEDSNSWWRHQMETFSALLAFCAGNSPVTGEFPTQRPMMRSFGVFFVLSLNKRLSKQSWGWWFETPSRPLWCRHCSIARIIWCPLWRHCNVLNQLPISISVGVLWKIVSWPDQFEFYRIWILWPRK